ncbi:hypothetical protein ACTXG7_22885 [Mycolicibacterium sp. Dal123E01]|uniref:hypothetical protein n=1 Tax=Mycolicibacterium sp. Dal123E01 TaxID=3457578 RepID=UPI00403E4B8F
MCRRSGLIVVVLLVALLAGCGRDDSRGSAASARGGAVMLNDVSVSAVLDAIAKAKLPVVNARNTTSTRCPEAGCVQAIDTDAVLILKFPSTGRAELYAAAVPEMVQVEDIVVEFAPALTSQQKAAYGQAVKNAVLTPTQP